MINSIKCFEKECINKFKKLENDFMKEPQKLAEYVFGITEELHSLGLKMIQESLEEMNGMLSKSRKRLQHWVVESHEKKQLITSLETVTFEKTLFTNIKTGKREYLPDRIMDLEKHERMSEDAVAGITYVLDEFYLEKYLTKLKSHMKDSLEDETDELRTAIQSKTKKRL